MIILTIEIGHLNQRVRKMRFESFFKLALSGRHRPFLKDNFNFSTDKIRQAEEMASDLILDLLTDKKEAPLRKVGVEVERLALNAQKEVIRYSRDVEPLFQELAREAHWEVFFESEGHILGLKKGRHYLSLEPGAQVEIAAAPKEHLFDLRDIEREIFAEIRNTQAARDWTWVEIGLNPWSQVEEIELIPSARYRYMSEYFPNKAKRGLEMMRLSTGNHLNIDFYLEPEAIEMLRVGCYLSPFVTALFANSPYQFGKSTGAYSERTFVWQETDPLRCGYPEFLFEKNCRLSDYSAYVRSRPLMYFYGENSQVIQGQGETFDDLPVELQEKNAVLALRQIFTEARLKPCCVEIRCFDQLPEHWRYASLAFVLGLVYDDSIRQELNEEALAVDPGQWREWQERAARKSLEDDELWKKCRELYDRSRSGLLKRSFGEEKLLEEALPLLEARKSPAHWALEKSLWL